MFGFLKKKLKETVEKFTKKASDSAAQVEEQELTQAEQEQLAAEEQIVQEEPAEDIVEEQAVETEQAPEESTKPKTDDPEVIGDAIETIEEVVPHHLVREDEVTSAPEQESALEETVVEEQQEAQEQQEEPAKPESETVSEPIIDLTEETNEPEPVVEEVQEELKKDPIEKPKEKKKGFFGKLFGTKEKKDDFDVVAEHEEKQTTTGVPEYKDAKTQAVEALAVEEQEDKPAIPAEFTEKTADIVIERKEPSVSRSVPESKVDPVIALEDVKDETKKKKGFFGKLKERIVKFKLTEEAFEELFWEFELAMLENNVAVEVIEKIKKDLHDTLTQEQVSRRGIETIIMQALKESLEDILDVEPVDLLAKVKSKKPYVIAVIGVNGSGKTTSIAKLVHLLQKNKLSVVVAASDTFRAAAIQQLEEHTTKLGVKLIKHDYGADPSAVAFDAIKHATAKGIDVVLVDTAGRLQSNSNLMDELKKLIRVNNPDFKLFVGESITGNDCTEQAVAFNEAVGIDGIILSKADVDDKGGAAISVSYVTQKPILYLGTGQTYDDLTPFNKENVLENLGL